MNRRTKLAQLQPQSLQSLTQFTTDLRRTVSARLMRDFGVRVPPTLIRRVLDEAMEVAQGTGFPALFFPAVAEEKARFVSAALGSHPEDHSTRALSHAA